MHDTKLVARLGARSAARAFRKNDDLASARELRPRARGHLRERQRAAAAVDRDHARLPGVPAEERNEHQLALEDVGRIVEHQKERKRLPQRLMLGSDQDRTPRNPLKPAERDLDAADITQQHEIDARPEFGDLDDGAPRQHQRRNRRQKMHEQVQIEQHVEDDRANDDQHERTCFTGAERTAIKRREGRPQPREDVMLTVKQAAERLGISPTLVYALCARKRIRHERRGLWRGGPKHEWQRRGGRKHQWLRRVRPKRCY